MNQLLQQYQQDLALRGYSYHTQHNYFSKIKYFFDYTNNDPEVSEQNIKSYLYYLINDRKLSNEYLRSSYSALKYFCVQTLDMPWVMDQIPRLKKTKKLPVWLTQKEVFKLIHNAANIKHKALLLIVYSSGLRVSEVSQLKLTDIIRDKMRINVRQGKGAKDRYTILSSICLSCLEYYWKKYRPEFCLFPGKKQNHPISIRACQYAFQLAKSKAGILKKCGIHSLRHSFATHYLESGGGIFQLQQFLGHKRLKTTLVYLHIQEEKIQARSPLDVYGKQEEFIR